MLAEIPVFRSTIPRAGLQWRSARRSNTLRTWPASHRRLYAGTNNAATNSLSNYICEEILNKHRGGQRLSARQFSLLMAGLVALLLLLYLQIVW